MAKLTPHQKGMRTRRRNAAKCRASRREEPTGRLQEDGATHPDQIRKRLLWLARERGISVGELPRGRVDVPTMEMIAFCSKHGVTVDWLVFGRPRDLLHMLRQVPPAPPPSATGLLEKLERLNPRARAFVAERVEALLSGNAQ